MSDEFLVGGVWEQIFINSVFSYLSCRDLYSVSVAFRMFSHAIMTADLWINLKKRLFSLPHVDVIGGLALAMTNNGSADDRFLRNQCAKEKCGILLKQRSMIERRIERGRATLMDDAVETGTAQRYVIYSLNVFLLHLSAPLSFLLLFLTVLLFAQHFDGSDFPPWVCAIPLELLFLYTITVVSLARVFLAKVNHM